MAFPPAFKKKKKIDPALEDATELASEVKSKLPPKGKKKFEKKKKKGFPFKSLPGGPKSAKGQISALEQM